MIGQLTKAKETHMYHCEDRDTLQHSSFMRSKKMTQLRRDIEVSKDSQAKIADKICAITIENKQRQDDKEMVMILLQHIYRAVKGRQHDIKRFVRQIESDELRVRVNRMLAAHKIVYK